MSTPNNHKVFDAQIPKQICPNCGRKSSSVLFDGELCGFCKAERRIKLSPVDPHGVIIDPPGERCQCTAEEVLAGHREDCPLNKELAPAPLPPPRKPFEEMDRDEMIIAYTHLRASVAEYVAGLHQVEADHIKAEGERDKLQLQLQSIRDCEEANIPAYQHIADEWERILGPHPHAGATGNWQGRAEAIVKQRDDMQAKLFAIRAAIDQVLDYDSPNIIVNIANLIYGKESHIQL